MEIQKRYEYSPLEEIFFSRKIKNIQFYEDIEEDNKNKINANRNINKIKDELLNTNISLDTCQKLKDYYFNTKNKKNIQNYFFFYDYRKCIHNVDGKIYIQNNPFSILSDNKKRDDRLNKNIKVENYNTFAYAYNI
ncbi:hypothetical protein PGSY75_0802900 [Plasmodium gaboni]|uniref:Uncharacterized protein n=1 Tax=Plasmodium gaboni TaxID=647221 RepID=A0A151LN27_9APIC|nr:hypothetical protein PGSY75_0802900 [Plasmodium gaboni]KYO00633.1 hypothetical protein PGSY75_0802900 [Plasmodium gaboni]SOV22119.1 conserved Plasmodium protein, unknown function [Plasmodium sp. DRC-Itaito]